MDLAVISFTPRGTEMCRKLVEKLADLGHVSTGYIPEKYADGQERDTGKQGRILVRRETLDAWTERIFPAVDGLVFVSAAGIAVRAVAPWVRDKMTDPAVVVVDEGGQYAISLLSGHLGGANDLARQVAGAIGAQPVITTASDVEGICAVDLWARDHGLVITDRVQARQVQAQALEGKPVGVFWDPWLETCLPWLGREPLPRGWKRLCKADTWQRARIWITVSSREDGTEQEKRPVLRLVPQVLVLGIGCRRGVAAGQIRQQVEQVLAGAGLDISALCRIASIDLKKEEPGILDLAGQLQVPYETFTAEELENVKQPVEESDFVRSVTGTGNVCERAALLSAGEHGRLVVGKKPGNGITVAVAARGWKY